MTKPLRAAVIGCGRIGAGLGGDPVGLGIHSHAAAYAACPDTSLVALCDRDPAALTWAAERFCVQRRYSDWERLLHEEQPDLVSVCTPDPTHYAIVTAALKSARLKGLIAEKPLARQVAEAEEIISLASERGIRLAVNYSRRYAPGFARIRTLLSSAAIGEIQTVSGYYTKGLIHNGTHWLDLLRFLAGEVRGAWGVDTRREGGEDPTLDAVLELETGAPAHLLACDADAFALFEMDLVGTRGRIRVQDSGLTLEVDEVVDDPHFPGYRRLRLKEAIKDGFRDVVLNAVEDLVTCVVSGGEPRCSGKDGLAALRIAWAVRESVAAGRVVAVEQT